MSSSPVTLPAGADLCGPDGQILYSAGPIEVAPTGMEPCGPACMVVDQGLVRLWARAFRLTEAAKGRRKRLREAPLKAVWDAHKGEWPRDLGTRPDFPEVDGLTVEQARALYKHVLGPFPGLRTLEELRSELLEWADAQDPPADTEDGATP